MAQIHWLNPVSGSFADTSVWRGGLVPGASDDAVLDAAGSGAYTVSSPATETVSGVQTASNATLAIAGGVFTARNGTDGGVNAGLILIAGGASLTLASGVEDNSGRIALQSGAAAVTLTIGAAGATLSGVGQLLLDNSASNRIVGATSIATLTNIDNTINGAGQLGAGQLTLINQAKGVIVGSQTTALIVDTGANAIANAGQIVAKGAGGVTIQSAVANSGVLEALGGALTVNGAVSGTGRAVIAGGTLDFTSTFNQSVAFLAATGVLELGRSQGYTALVIGFSKAGGASLDLRDIGFVGAAEATFSGTVLGGTLTVTDGTHTARIALKGDYTTSRFTASSDGRSGTSVTDSLQNFHWLHPTSEQFQTAANWTNGLVPGSANDAILDAHGSTNYTVTASATQTVNDIQTATNATLAITAGTFAATKASGSGINAGTITVADGATFQTGGTLANTGVLDFLGTSKGADLVIGAAGLTLTGGGEIVLADSLAAPFQPCPPKYSIDKVLGASEATLTNVDNTIVGAGYIGVGANSSVALVNEAKGVIDASLDTDLVLNRLGTIVNRGLLEATGAGGLYIGYSTVDNSSGGVISGAGANVYVSYTDIIGGTLTSSGSGSVLLAGSIYFDDGPSILDGATAGAVTNQGLLFVSNQATLTVDGAVDNLGVITVAASYLSSSLIVGASGLTLTGAGKVILQGTNPNTQITGVTPAATLVNVDNTISGQGRIGAGSLTLINQAGGVIDANQRAALTLDTGANTLANAGLLKADGGGQLIVEGVVDDTAGGRIEALGAGSIVLQGATVEGGAIVLNDSPGVVALVVGTGATTLTGGGQVTLVGYTNVIKGASGSATLDNVGDTISGSGRIGAGVMTLVNGPGGTIEATASRGALVIDTGTNTIANAGLIEAAVGGICTIASAVDNGGMLEAAGGSLTVSGAVGGAGSATISGGTLGFTAAFSQAVAFTGTTGVLELGQSQSYAGAVSGFSTMGGTSLDLLDIGFASSTEATFSGTGSGGTLTVTDGSHTAHIALIGDYTASTFVASSDGHGGTTVVDPTAASAAHQFIAAAAALGAHPAAATSVARDTSQFHPPMLTRPVAFALGLSL